MIRNLTVLFALLVALASCSGGAGTPEAPVPPTGPAAALRLEISLGDQAGSRAPSSPEGGYDGGSEYENYIDLEGRDFFVAVYGADNKLLFIPDAKNIELIRESEGQYSKRYTLQFPISPEEYASIPDGKGEDRKSFKILLLANWGGNYPDEESGEDLSTFATDSKFERSFLKNEVPAYPGPALKAADKIALFGVKTFENVEIFSWRATELDGKIHLLRSMAKVEVRLDDDPEVADAMKDVVLSDVKITKVSTKAALAPYGIVDESDYRHGSYGDDYTDTPSVPADCMSDKGYELKGNDGKFAVYIPEFVNLDAENKPLEGRAQISFNLDGEEYTYDFAEYEPDADGYSEAKKYFNIMRNVKYIFLLRKIGVEIVPQIKVVPWTFYRLEDIEL